MGDERKIKIIVSLKPERSDFMEVSDTMEKSWKLRMWCSLDNTGIISDLDENSFMELVEEKFSIQGVKEIELKK